MIDLNDMRLFARVVEAGSFSAAARGLGMPKSTLSRRIARLEQSLDTRLLQRTTRALHLTEVGAIFHARCIRVVAEAEEAERSLSLEAAVPRGLLRITAPVEIGYALLGTIAAEYRARYPLVRLHIDLSNRLVDLVEEGYDLALRAGILPDSSLIARRLGDSRSVVCAAPAYLARHPAPSTPQALREHDCLVYADGDGRPSEWVFNGPGGSVELRLQGVISANTLGVLRDAALAGAGVAMLPEMVCLDALDEGRLVALLSDWELPRGGIYAVYPSPRHLTPKVRGFIEFIAGRL